MKRRLYDLRVEIKRKGITLGDDDHAHGREVTPCGCGKRRAVPTLTGLRCVRCGKERKP